LGLGTEIGVRQALVGCLQVIDLADVRPDALDFTLVLGADDFFYPIDHALLALLAAPRKKSLKISR
jgi:hypothetical protein